MKHVLQQRIAALAIAFALPTHLAIGHTGLANVKGPPVPSDLQVPAGNTAYLKARATGAQNYVCVPGASGPFWKFVGPQATLFVTLPRVQGVASWQPATHFLSSNASEVGTGRPTWPSSVDTSAVWGTAIANSSDPDFVAPGAIPWLLVEVTGAQRELTGAFALTHTTFIQRVNTSGGVAPSAGCNESAYGELALVPYTTDYYFYRANRRK